MTTSKVFPNDAIQLFITLRIECLEQAISMRSAEFLHKVGEYIARGKTPAGFAELCVMANIGEELPKEVWSALKERLLQYDLELSRIVEAYRVELENAKRAYKSWEDATQVVIEKNACIRRYIRSLG